jgi:hypothetical protein
MRLDECDFKDADLRRANLEDAEMKGASIRNAYLQDANLRGADLRNADLRGADMRSAHLDEAVLTGACADENTIWPDDFGPEHRRDRGVIAPSPDTTPSPAPSGMRLVVGLRRRANRR